jgi:hypothetical protein
LILSIKFAKGDFVKHPLNDLNNSAGRRSFMKNGLAVAGAATIGAGLLADSSSVFAQESSGSLSKGDAAILRFLAAAEISGCAM